MSTAKEIRIKRQQACFISACILGRVERVAKMHRTGFDIHFKNEKGLRSAAFYGRLNVVRYLAENLANVNIKEGNPMVCAADVGRRTIVKYLLNFANDTVKNQALLAAHRSGHISTVDLLIKRGADASLISDLVLNEASSCK